MSSQPVTLLVVDDEQLNLELIDVYLADSGFHLDMAGTGEEAWARLVAAPERYHAVLLDRMLPDLDGVAILRRMKTHAQLRHIPVILQTARGGREDIVEGMQAGAYYYLAKPFDETMLTSVVKAAVRDRGEFLWLQEQLNANAQGMHLLRSGRFQVRDFLEGRALASLLAGACPDPRRVITGLSELIINAIEHGNLGISYTEKSQLLAEDRWHEETRRRMGLPQYRDKRVEVEVERDDGRITFTIRDEGPGFDWQAYLTLSPERGTDSHGRGIAMANLFSFDRLEYAGQGNVAVATVHLSGTDT